MDPGQAQVHILVIDNYDSFTFNLVQAFGAMGCRITVRRNDRITLDEIPVLQPDRIVISPGPGRPEQGGISTDVICAFAGKIPILGVCLGHQCIAQAFGGEIVSAKRLMHGKTSQIVHDGSSLFQGIPNPFQATRYHSLIVDEDSLPEGFFPTARSTDGELMGIRHPELLLEGVQFHPESYLTPDGADLLRNFLAGFS